MYSAQIRILKQVDHESLATLLQRLDRLRLPAERLAVCGDHREGYLTDLDSHQYGPAGPMRDLRREGKKEGPYQSRKGKFQHQQVRRLLVASYLLERKRPRLIASWFARPGLVVYRMVSISSVAADTTESMRSAARGITVQEGATHHDPQCHCFSFSRTC